MLPPFATNQLHTASNYQTVSAASSVALRRWTMITCERRKRQQSPPGLTGFACHTAGNRPVGLTATGCVGANVSWRAWARTWMRKFTGNYLMDKNYIQFRKCPELLIVKRRGLWKDYTCSLSLSSSSGIQWCCCWKELLGSTDPWSDPVLTVLHPSLSVCLSPKHQLCSGGCISSC